MIDLLMTATRTAIGAMTSLATMGNFWDDQFHWIPFACFGFDSVTYTFNGGVE
jgi:hypothetical protein